MSKPRDNRHKDLFRPASTPQLRRLFNSRGEQLIGVSGYGENRPLPNILQEDEIGKRKNRRIDLRFLMATPRSADAVVNLMEDRLDRRK